MQLLTEILSAKVKDTQNRRPAGRPTFVWHAPRAYQCITESDKDDDTRLMFVDLKNFLND